MTDSSRRILRGLCTAGFLFAGWLSIQPTDKSDMNVWAGSRSPNSGTTVQGDAERGRTVFNGKGICFYCHGVDGFLDRRPPLGTDTVAFIARLNPPPTDLRNSKVLRLKTDKERVRAIREGYPGTGMFPDTRMTDQDLGNLVAYLSLLRRESPQ